jgi:hypothetical protein
MQARQQQTGAGMGAGSVMEDSLRQPKYRPEGYAHRTFRHVLGGKHHPDAGIVKQPLNTGGLHYQSMSLSTVGPNTVPNKKKNIYPRNPADRQIWKTMTLNTPGVSVLPNQKVERYRQVKNKMQKNVEHKQNATLWQTGRSISSTERSSRERRWGPAGTVVLTERVW